MKRKALGAQRPRHNNELGEGASTAQRSDSPAQQFIQRFHRRGSENEVSAKAHIGEADVKRSGRSQHRATQQMAHRSSFSTAC